MYCDCITDPSTVTHDGAEVCCVCGYPQRATKCTTEEQARRLTPNENERGSVG